MERRFKKCFLNVAKSGRQKQSKSAGSAVFLQNFFFFFCLPQAASLTLQPPLDPNGQVIVAPSPLCYNQNSILALLFKLRRLPGGKGVDNTH
jgi:hypothetical protein